MAWGQSQAQLQRLLVAVEVREEGGSGMLAGWALGNGWGPGGFLEEGPGPVLPLFLPAGVVYSEHGARGGGESKLPSKSWLGPS